MNEYYELIEDSDLNGDGAPFSWIWECPECHALFGSKAIACRTIFPWFGYHPADGNCKVVTEDTYSKLRDRSADCERQCKCNIIRVTSVQQLTAAINAAKNGNK